MELGGTLPIILGDKDKGCIECTSAFVHCIRQECKMDAKISNVTVQSWPQ